MLKLWGCVLVIVGCGGVGFSMCQNHRHLERSLEQLVRCLDWMILELNYRMSPLSVLCRGAGDISDGEVKKVFLRLAEELDRQIVPDGPTCMAATLATVSRMPAIIQKHFENIGLTLGQFDLQGQIAGLEASAALCRRDLEEIMHNRQLRLRNYQTLGLCAGIGLVILLL